MGILYSANFERDVARAHNAYWIGALDGKLCKISIDNEECPVQARKLVEVYLDETNEPVHGAVLVSIQGGKV
jgi:hypothetical protein